MFSEKEIFYKENNLIDTKLIHLFCKGARQTLTRCLAHRSGAVKSKIKCWRL